MSRFLKNLTGLGLWEVQGLNITVQKKIRKNSKKIGRHFDLEFEVKIVDFDDIQRRMGCPCIRFQFKLTI